MERRNIARTLADSRTKEGNMNIIFYKLYSYFPS